jgi:hypothetical protein
MKGGECRVLGAEGSYFFPNPAPCTLPSAPCFDLDKEGVLFLKYKCDRKVERE